MKLFGTFLFSASIAANAFRSSSYRRSPVVSILSRLYMSSDKTEAAGHEAKFDAPPMSEEDKKTISAFEEHQRNAPRPSLAEEIRTLIVRSIGFGVLSTNSAQLPGYPSGSVVGFELTEEGYPFFVFSSMSSHTKDISQDGRVSLTVMASDFKGAAEGRCVILGKVVKVTSTPEIISLKERYLARHKDAYWVDFGDFQYYKMESIEIVRYVGGFAMAGSVTGASFLAASPDSIAAFSAPVMKHMNDDHADSTSAMVRHYVGVPCTSAEITAMDRLGMTVKALVDLPAFSGGQIKIRIPFVREVTQRKEVKEVLVEMTRASASQN